MGERFKIGVLVSGRGTNLQSLIDAAKEGRLGAEIAVVISNRPKAFALERAQKQGIPAQVIDDKTFSTFREFEDTLIAELQNRGVDLVVLAGFMKIVSPVLLRAFPLRVINIHPSLLPAFPGLHVQKKAIEYGARFSGCTVHFVDEGVDSGPIIIQAVVPIEPNDTEETLSERILKEEHKILPQAVRWLAQGCVRIEGRRVIIKNPQPLDLKPHFNPPLESN